jgi:hypothetical protein
MTHYFKRNEIKLNGKIEAIEKAKKEKREFFYKMILKYISENGVYQF